MSARVPMLTRLFRRTVPENGSPKGYGRVGVRVASRVAWETVFGPVPKGMNVLHRCDNPPCINPAHLWLGTLADNNRDAAAKGRMHEQLSGDQVRTIRRRSVDGESRMALAAEYGVSASMVSAIALGRKRRHVGVE